MHTVAYGKRLVDVIALLESDFRIQVSFTAPPHMFASGVPEYLARLGGTVVAWEEAVRTRFDLVLAAGPRGVEHLDAPLVALPHGANFIKRVMGTPDDGVAGLRRRDLTPGGKLPAAVVLAHDDDLAELKRACPEAAPVAEVVGDPVFDRMTASLAGRGTYRRALGVGEGHNLVAVASTWGPGSLFTRFESLLPRLAHELRPDQFMIVALLHPNIWATHSVWQVNAWLARCRQMGVHVIAPEADWRSVLVAADWIIGDHGSVTVYGTVTGAPILLTGSPHQEIAPDSPAADLSQAAPVLSPMHGIAEQLAYAAAEYRRSDYQAIAARITSHPGEFARRMRRLIYRHLGLGQPAHPPATLPLPLPPALNAWGTSPGEASA
ncbi:hypothetical protein [Actinacidiphila acididurans]|uniref:hypothetical protein n=1 Tax=Actinacidiphila acididurans TaxID=2784346 RepID=UPI0027DCE5A7|nr:hypothetical protein [Actinacidiphila acididurans]